MTQVPDATPAAQQHAEELGVDLSQVTPTGASGQITKADVAAAAAPGDDYDGEGDEDMVHFYCLDAQHPGSGGRAPIIDEERIFVLPADEAASGCPVCPACGREVSATECEYDGGGNPVPPGPIRDLAERLATQSI